MPGLNQLKAFSDDIQKLGDEEKIRRQRGEKISKIPLPQGISEADDSNDFIIGLPDGTESSSDAAKDEYADADLSEILGESAPTSESVNASDLDSILSPDLNADEDALAEFLDDDVSSIAQSADSSDPLANIGDLGDLGSLDSPDSISGSSGTDAPLEDINFDDLLGSSPASEASPKNDAFNDLDSALSDLGELSDHPPASTETFEPLDAPAAPGDSPLSPESGSDDFDMSSFMDDLPPISEPGSSSGEPATILDDAPSAEFDDILNEMGDLGNVDDSLADKNSLDDLASFNPETLADDSATSDTVSSDSPETIDSGLSEPTSESTDDDLSSAIAGMDDLGDLGSLDGTSGTGEADLGGFNVDDLINDVPTGDSGTGDALSSDSPETIDSELSEPTSESTGDDLSSAIVGMDDLGDLGGLGGTSGTGEADLGGFNVDDLINDVPSGNSGSETSIELGNEVPSPDSENSGIDDMISGMNFDNLGSGSGGEVPDAAADVPSEELNFGTEGADGEISFDNFDTSEMGGVDFGSSSSSSDEFPVTGEASDDDFELDSSFEIPGFSDTETADMGKKRPLIDTPDFSQAKEGRPKNSLTDEEYVQFKKNLSNYPLNLRIAIEDFISNDEFTDDIVFEIIEKILKKTSARQLATQLEKLLDVSINIPRDFEHRSFAEYEAYKQSFQYQLKNRIIPAAIVGVILAFVCFGLFKAGEHFIYKPVMANIHYKQGYTLLEANEFPQSEDEFKEAVAYKPVKKWFFKYAQGYRERKQFERAAQMYKNTLRYFNHDKQAGIEYAEMELYDRSNYALAEEITRREVLDYHINDADGILLLGDVFLEWAEVDPEKYELAKAQYLDLMQRYGQNNVYLSRMLRYNIRTDKLREVLTYKNMLYQSKQDRQNLKNLGAEDWTELSGYLLEKLYGKLDINDEYLRASIEDVFAMLNLAIKADPSNPIARYNLARYFIQNGNTEQAKTELSRSLDLFDSAKIRTKKNVYREINATRVLGKLYAENREYIDAQTIYTRGINLYNEEHENSGLEPDENVGKLFGNMADLDYFVSGDVEDALYNYEMALKTKNDTPSINFRVGSIYYTKKDYDKALASFIKVAEKEPRDTHVLLSLGNVLSLRGDNFAASSYYSDLIDALNKNRDAVKVLLPHLDADDYETVDMYLKGCNNLGVALHRLARQTGNSNLNAEAMVRLSDSIRAWDALTRNPETMVRLEGSNLAAQNTKYITHPMPDFEPAIYTDIPRVLFGEKGLE